MITTRFALVEFSILKSDMRAKVIIGFGVVVLSLVIFLIVQHFFTSTWDVVNLPPKNETIVAFGDSLVSGIGSSQGNDFVSLLSKKIGRDIINEGIPGNTSADGLARVDDVLALDPGLVIVLLGGNDALRRISKDKTYENLSLILDKLTHNGIAVVLVAVRGGLLNDPYDEMYHVLAKTHRVALVPNVLSDILLNPDLTADQLHPNDKGYAIVADRIYKVLEPLITS